MDTALNLTDLAERLRRHVAALAQAPRVPGSHAHSQAADYIVNHLEQSGFIIQQERLEGGTEIPGVNWLTRPVPDQKDLPLFIVGAHYDTVAGSPGADDNASGVAALLELAAWLHDHPPASGRPLSRLQLAVYDLEEYGMIGSYAHGDQLERTGTQVRGMISLEMLGYSDQRPGSQRLPPHLAGLYPKVGNFIGVCGNEASGKLVEVVSLAMKSVPGLPVESIAVPGAGESLPESRLSDHSSFWDRGYEALMITDTSFFRNPHYHQDSDTPETLNYEFLAKVTAGVCESINRLLES
jgi:Zn-dependent M28 family amino/carboxypeptidase